MTHKTIKTENYILIVDDSEIKTWYYDEYIKRVHHSGGAEYSRNDITKNIIAHLPLNGYGILEGVDLLPPLEQEDDVEKLAKKHLDEHHNNEDIAHPEMYDEYNSFIKGYNKAKEKYKYTEEDMILCWKYASIDKHQGFGDQIGDNYKSFIQSLSQPKMPIAFECETIFLKEENTGTDLVWGRNAPKTTTNPQGQRVWVGKWIY